MMQLDHGSRRSSQRLPVNPRRHKVAPAQRKRVATACNSCNARRTKCSGDLPCSQCSSTARDCVYPSIVEKVSVPKTELEALKKKVDIYEKALHDALPDPTRRQELLHRAASPESPSPTSPFASAAAWPATQFAASGNALLPCGASSVKTEPADDDNKVLSPGRLLHDPDGISRYVGETSGATFLDHLKELMGSVLPVARHHRHHEHQPALDGCSFLSSLGSYTTCDSSPLSSLDANPLWFPPDGAIRVVMSELRYLIQDGGGQWPSGGIYWWGDLESIPARVPLTTTRPPALDDHRHLAFYHAALAVACHSTPSGSHPSLSEPYFARAAMLLGNPLNMKRRTIGDVAALAMMGFYLIETNRPDAAYMYVTAAMHISIMLGAHRGWVDERGKRIFWSVYALDRWLSCLMGRPPTIQDDAIELPLPVDNSSMPPAAGLRAHVELSRISGHVVGNTLHGTQGEAGSRRPESAIWMLERWKLVLPQTLRLSPEGLSNDPACCLLHMRYNQLLVVAIRPLFFSAVKRAVAERLIARAPLAEADTRQHGHLECCIAAAARNMRLARHVIALNGHRRLLHAGLHFIFNAGVCLILRSLIAKPGASAEELRAATNDVDFAMERMDEASNTGSGDGGRCAETLRDLRVLVDRLTASVGSDATPVGQPTVSSMAPAPAVQEPTLPPMPGEEDVVLYGELVTWMGDDWPACNSYMNE